MDGFLSEAPVMTPISVFQAAIELGEPVAGAAGMCLFRDGRCDGVGAAGVSRWTGRAECPD